VFCAFDFCFALLCKHVPQAALEIEALIKALQENNDTDRICSVIAMLGQV
jgi:hypothetical protein